MTTTVTTTTTHPPALPPAPRIPLGRLVSVELRKSVDTRAGVLLLVLTVLLTLAPVGWQLTHLTDGVPDYDVWVSTARGGVVVFLPVLGILAMTSEWTQRTALTTFTLVPRRGRVLAAKLAAAVLLGTAVMLFVLAVAAAALLAASGLKGTTLVWGDVASVVGGSLVTSALNIVMGAAFGAAIAQSAAAITVFLVAPTLWQVAGTALLGDDAQWLDVFQAFGRLSSFELAGHGPQVVTSVVAWVVLPLAFGWARALRRNVS
jgi:hypothetical protein